MTLSIPSLFACMLALSITGVAIGDTAAISPQPINTRDTPLPPAITLPSPPAGTPKDVPAVPISADQAALIALRHQPNIAAAIGALTAASGRTEQARSQYLPSIAITAGYSQSKISQKTGATSPIIGSNVTGPDATDSIVLQQRIFDFGHTVQIISQAADLERASGLTLTNTQADTVLAVKQNFYALAQAARLVSVNEDNYRAQYQHLEEARASQLAGLGLVSDVVVAQTAVSNAALQLNIARNTAQIAQVTLAVSMGLDARTPLQAADGDEPTPPSMDLNALIDKAVKSRPDLLAADANLDAAEQALRAARSSNAPVISAAAGYAGKDTVFPPDSGSVTAGVALSFDPFDSGLTNGRIREAKGNVETAKANVEALRQSVASDVSQAYLNSLLAEQRVTTAQDGVTNAQVAEQLADGRFRAGLGIFLEVTDAQAALVSAQTDLVNAHSALNEARASLAHAIGTRFLQKN